MTSVKADLVDRLNLHTARHGFLLLLIVAMLALVVDGLDGVPYATDADDRVRALQIRELATHLSLFDMRLLFIEMPEPYISHYSRIVDLPYVAITLILKPFFGFEQAIAAAMYVWPPVMVMFAIRLAVFILERVFGPQASFAQLLFLGFLMFLALLEFFPTRVDHHNLQMVLVLAMMAGVVASHWTGGFAAGLAAATSIAVGLECLPYIAAALGLLALAAVWRPEEHARKLIATGTALIAAIPLVGGLSLGPGTLLVRQCDAIGLPALTATVAGGSILVLAPSLWRLRLFDDRKLGLPMRLTSLVSPALLVGAGLIAQFPECLSGPYGAVSAITKSMWLDQIHQEAGLFDTIATMPRLFVGFCLAYTIVVAAGLCHVWRNRAAGDFRSVFVVTMALVSLIVFVLAIRSYRFMAIIAPLALPAARSLAVSTFSGTGEDWRSGLRWLVISLVLPSVFWGTAFVLAPEPTKRMSVYGLLTLNRCRGEDISVLGRIDGGRILAGPHLSLHIAETYRQHKIAVVPLHRSFPGIDRFLTAMTATDQAVRDAALASFDYLAICAGPVSTVDIDRAPLLKALITGERVPGLDPVEVDPAKPFRLYRIGKTDRDRAAPET